MNNKNIEDHYVDDLLNKVIKANLEYKINNLIEKETEKFRTQLICEKDQYISEIMKGIRIAHERNIGCMNYKIIFENIQKIEENENK